MENTRTHAQPTPEVAHTEEAQSTEPVKSDKDEKPDVQKYKPLALYKKENRKPYSAEFFDVQDYGHFARDPVLDIDKLVPKLEYIDSAIKDLIEEKGYKDELATFDELMESIFEKLNVSSIDTLQKKLEKVYNYLKNNSEYEKKYGELLRLKEQMYGVSIKGGGDTGP